MECTYIYVDSGIGAGMHSLVFENANVLTKRRQTFDFACFIVNERLAQWCNSNILTDFGASPNYAKILLKKCKIVLTNENIEIKIVDVQRGRFQMIQAQIEQLINRLKAEKESELRNVQQKIMEDKILPFNANIDSLRDKAIAQKTEELNNAITALREKYNTERQEIIDASERNKTANLEAVIAAETSIINSKYDSAISDLQACMGRVKE